MAQSRPNPGVLSPTGSSTGELGSLVHCRLGRLPKDPFPDQERGEIPKSLSSICPWAGYTGTLWSVLVASWGQGGVYEQQIFQANFS